MAKIDTVVDASGYAKPAIFIDVEGDEWEETIDRSKTLVKECELSSEEIVKKIADAGIVGLGGACFPTQVKLCPPPSFKAECVIINAVECEPYPAADDAAGHRNGSGNDCRPSADAGTRGRSHGRCLHSDESREGK